MNLAELRLREFRNIAAATLRFTAPRIVILGPNGQGKTNLLEAVHLLCLTRAFRTHRLTQLVREEATGFRVEGSFLSPRSGRRELKAETKDGSLVFELDGKTHSRRTDIFGQFPLVLLSPESMEITQGAPEGRRRYMDRLLSLGSPVYLDALLRYQRALKQRTRLLQAGTRDPGLDLWEQQLAEHGHQLLQRRQSFLKELEAEVRGIYRDGFAEDSLPAMELRCNLGPDLSRDELAGAWHEARLKDQERGWAGLGPHRDELRIKLEGRLLRDFGSQGQHKLLMLALALAEVRLLKKHTGENPLLLLDDLFGMLDDGRIRRIGDAVDPETQILISTTSDRHLDVIGGELQVFHCQNGQFREEAA